MVGLTRATNPINIKSGSNINIKSIGGVLNLDHQDLVHIFIVQI